MKKIVLLSFILFGSILAANTAFAKGIPVIYSSGPKFITEHQLPDSVHINGEHVNFGVAFEQFSIFWVPMWNYGTTEYALITDNEEVAYKVEADELAYIKAEYGIDTDKSPRINFWNSIGGKIIWLVLLGLIIWGIIPSKNKTEEAPEA